MVGKRGWRSFVTLYSSLSAALVFSPQCFRATAQTAAESAGERIEIRVKDAQGLPVAHALVSLRNALTGYQRQQVSRDSGDCGISGLPQGRYTLSVFAPGLASEGRTIEVRRDTAPQVVDVQMTMAHLSGEVTVVSGSRVEELQTDSATRVEALTREQMEDTGHERVSDVLGELPGVLVRSGSTASVGAEQVEGIDSRQVLVLQDGLPLIGARGIKSGIVNLNRQDVGKLERVEVAKGAASALYGSDAMGGVINMITREPSLPLQLGLSLSGGSLGAVDGRMDLGSRWKKLTLFTDLESHRQDSYGLIPGDRGTVGPNFERNDLFAKAGYSLSERATIGFSATAYHNRQTGLANSSAGLTLGTSNDSTQAYALTGDFVLTSGTTLQTRAYAARYDENSRTNYADANAPAFGFANLNERYHRLDATLSQQLGTWQLVQGGVEWAQDVYRGANRLVGDNAGQQITTNDVWVQDRLQPLRNLTVTLGGRLQHHSLYGNHLVPKVGLAYRVGKYLVARASYGKGFRAPDLGQLYYRFANPASFYQVIGNPNLRPESSESFSTGLWYQRTRYKLGVHLYRHNLNNLIDTYTVGTPQTQEELATLLQPYGIPLNFNPLLNRLTFIYLNLNRARTEGFELNGDVALTPRVRVEGAYTLLEGVDRATELLLPQRHRHQGTVKAEYSRPRSGTLANVRGTFFSKWPLNPAAGTYGYGYRIWDLYASQRLRKGLHAFGAIDNLTDSRDRKLGNAVASFDRPDYGRTLRIGLRYSFAREGN